MTASTALKAVTVVGADHLAMKNIGGDSVKYFKLTSCHRCHAASCSGPVQFTDCHLFFTSDKGGDNCVCQSSCVEPC